MEIERWNLLNPDEKKKSYVQKSLEKREGLLLLLQIILDLF